MGKVQVSVRLDSELLSWAAQYGDLRRWSRAVVIEEALRHFREMTAGGVPDDPPAKVTPVKQQVAPVSDRLRTARANGWM